jgi:hypothetical protein
VPTSPAEIAMTESRELPAVNTIAEQPAVQHPLWPLVRVLGEIAARVQCLPAEEGLHEAVASGRVQDEVSG